LILRPSAFLFSTSSFHWSILSLSSTLIVRRIFRLEFVSFNRSDIDADNKELLFSINKCVQRCGSILSKVKLLVAWYVSACELTEQNRFCLEYRFWWGIFFGTKINQSEWISQKQIFVYFIRDLSSVFKPKIFETAFNNG
jgi:hypothetical protein